MSFDYDNEPYCNKMCHVRAHSTFVPEIKMNYTRTEKRWNSF